MEEFINDFKGIWNTFVTDLKRYDVLLQKLISYSIVFVVIQNFLKFDFLQEITGIYWLYISLMYTTGFFISLLALKKKWTSYISGTLKQFAQIVFTGLGILFMGLIISGHFIPHILITIIVLATFTKFYLAMFEYFEKASSGS